MDLQLLHFDILDLIPLLIFTLWRELSSSMLPTGTTGRMFVECRTCTGSSMMMRLRLQPKRNFLILANVYMIMYQRISVEGELI